MQSKTAFSVTALAIAAFASITLVTVATPLAPLAPLTRLIRVHAAEKPSAEYVEAMRTLAVVAAELPKRLAEDDAAGLDKLVIAARPAVGVVERYWSTRGVDSATAFAQTASKAIAEISVAVHLMANGRNPLATEGAEESIKNLTASCAGCHKVHRETLPDGTFAIK